MDKMGRKRVLREREDGKQKDHGRVEEQIVQKNDREGIRPILKAKKK